MWHVSTSARDRQQRIVAAPNLLETIAVRLLAGVGGDHEWWHWNPDARIGHLRVPVTPAETAQIPPGCALHDAGESGPQRPRTKP